MCDVGITIYHALPDLDATPNYNAQWWMLLNVLCVCRVMLIKSLVQNVQAHSAFRLKA